MFFSVIIPLYNKRNFIIQAVRSVLNQSYSNFELLVVDDGSSDDSVKVLEAEVSDPRVRVIQQPNMGGAGGQARNTGMAEAHGEWFAFLDADDLWLPNHLEELVAIIGHVNRPALISTRPVELPVGTSLEQDLRVKSKIEELNYFYEAGRKIGLNNCSSSAIHREVFEKLGGFINVRSGPDLEYWARVALSYPYVLSDRVTSIYYRGNMGNMEQIATKAKKESWSKVNSLKDVSPSLAMLAELAEEDPTLFEREDVRSYVNGRLRSGMRLNIRESRPKQAWALRKLMLGPVCRQAYALSLAAWLPIPILKLLNNCYSLGVKKLPR